MQNGSIVESGRTDTIFNNPQHAATQQLLAASPVLPVELRLRAS
jgi:peptide/nickel transport system ATP-binding protein